MIAKALKYGAIYFALVFGAGFVLGTVRVLLLEPRLGTRTAELLEIPIMLVVVYLAAKYVVSKMHAIQARLPYLVTGVSALILLLLLEFTLVLGLQDLSFDRYLESRDAIAFAAYLVSLIVFALMPLLLGSRKRRN